MPNHPLRVPLRWDDADVSIDLGPRIGEQCTVTLTVSEGFPGEAIGYALQQAVRTALHALEPKIQAAVEVFLRDREKAERICWEAFARAADKYYSDLFGWELRQGQHKRETE